MRVVLFFLQADNRSTTHKRYLFKKEKQFIAMGNTCKWALDTAENMKSSEVQCLIAVALQEGGSCIRRCKASPGYLQTIYWACRGGHRRQWWNSNNAACGPGTGWNDCFYKSPSHQVNICRIWTPLSSSVFEEFCLGIYCHVVWWKSTDILEEHVTSIFRIEE
jgi:hypothetical protein